MIKNSGHLGIAILDSGIDLHIQELREKIVYGITYEQKNGKVVISEDFMDSFGHGTNCADRIISACPECDLYILKIMNQDGKTSFQILKKAMEKCLALPVKVINLSLSVNREICPYETWFQDICRELYLDGKIICASVHNQGKSFIPASFREVIGVQSVYSEGTVLEAIYPEHNIQILADGTPVFVRGVDGHWNFFKGNSKATADVSGYCLKYLQLYQQLETKRILLPEILQGLSKVWSMNVFHMHTDDRLIEQDDTEKEISTYLISMISKLYGKECNCKELLNYPLFSDKTGINFFNFEILLKSVCQRYAIALDDFHNMSINDVCTLTLLTKVIKTKLCVDLS